MRIRRLILHISNVSNASSIELAKYDAEQTKNGEKFLDYRVDESGIRDSKYGQWITKSSLNVPCCRITDIFEIFAWMWLDDEITEQEAKDILTDLVSQDMNKRISLVKRLTAQTISLYNNIVTQKDGNNA